MKTQVLKTLCSSRCFPQRKTAAGSSSPHLQIWLTAFCILLLADSTRRTIPPGKTSGVVSEGTGSPHADREGRLCEEGVLEGGAAPLLNKVSEPRHICRKRGVTQCPRQSAVEEKTPGSGSGPSCTGVPGYTGQCLSLTRPAVCARCCPAEPAELPSQSRCS